nr:HutD family protein [Variibacter gotjawalensis]
MPATPWRNGGGVTREIAVSPPGAGFGDFLWRVSLATVAADGPFSVFAGIDRQIMLIEGEGLQLRSDDGAIDHRLDTPHEPFSFSGDVAIHGTLIAGKTLDFNVMSRRGFGTPELRVETETTTLKVAPCGVLLCLAGGWDVAGHELRKGDGLRWIDAPVARRLVPDGSDAAIAVATWRPIGD